MSGVQTCVCLHANNMSSQHHNQHNAATKRRQQQRQSTDEAHQQYRNRIIVNENHCYAYAMPTFAQHSHRRPPNHIQQHDCTKCWRSTQTPASSSSVVWTLGLAVVMMICLQSCFSSIVRVQANTIAASDNLTTTAMVFAPSSSSGAAEPAEPQAVIDNGSSAVYQLHQYEDPSAARNGTNASSGKSFSMENNTGNTHMCVRIVVLCGLPLCGWKCGAQSSDRSANLPLTCICVWYICFVLCWRRPTTLRKGLLRHATAWNHRTVSAQSSCEACVFLCVRLCSSSARRKSTRWQFHRKYLTHLV